MEIVRDFREWLAAEAGISTVLQGNLLKSIIIVLVLFLVRLVVLKLICRKLDDLRARYQWKKTTLYVTVIISLMVLGNIWFAGFESLTTYLGLLSAGLAIALKDPLVNIVGWGFILWRRPFQVGDRIQIGDVAGDVIDLRIFQFSLMEIGNWVEADQSTGRIVHVNNGLVFTSSLANFSKGFSYIWDEMPVVVTFESDWKKAKEILKKVVREQAGDLSAEAELALRKAASKFMVFYKNLTPIVYTQVDDIGVRLTMRYLCEPRKRRITEEKIWEAVLDAFAAEDSIDFAYPTQRFYHNVQEGKPGARATPSNP